MKVYRGPAKYPVGTKRYKTVKKNKLIERICPDCKAVLTSYNIYDRCQPCHRLYTIENFPDTSVNDPEHYEIMKLVMSHLFDDL